MYRDVTEDRSFKAAEMNRKGNRSCPKTVPQCSGFQPQFGAIMGMGSGRNFATGPRDEDSGELTPEVAGFKSHTGPRFKFRKNRSPRFPLPTLANRKLAWTLTIRTKIGQGRVPVPT
jgi:hypothetical protein